METASVSKFTNNDDGMYELRLTCYMKLFISATEGYPSTLEVNLDPIKKKVQADCGSTEKKIVKKDVPSAELKWTVGDVVEFKNLVVSNYFTIPQSPTCVFQIWVRENNADDKNAVSYITTTMLSAVPADGDTSNLKVDIATVATMTNKQWPGTKGE